MRVNKSLTAALSFGVTNIIFVFVNVSFTLTLFIYDSTIAILNKTLYFTLLYSYAILNLLIGIFGFVLTGNYGDILFQRYRDTKQFYFKIEVLMGLQASSLGIGMIYTIFLVVYFYMNKDDQIAKTRCLFLLLLSSLEVFLMMCLYFIHPDLFRRKRNAEIREIVYELENTRLCNEINNR